MKTQRRHLLLKLVRLPIAVTLEETVHGGWRLAKMDHEISHTVDDSSSSRSGHGNISSRRSARYNTRLKTKSSTRFPQPRHTYNLRNPKAMARPSYLEYTPWSECADVLESDCGDDLTSDCEDDSEPELDESVEAEVEDDYVPTPSPALSKQQLPDAQGTGDHVRRSSRLSQHSSKTSSGRSTIDQNSSNPARDTTNRTAARGSTRPGMRSEAASPAKVDEHYVGNQARDIPATPAASKAPTANSVPQPHETAYNGDAGNAAEKRKYPPHDEYLPRSQRHKRDLATFVREDDESVEAQKLRLRADMADAQEDALALRAAAIAYMERGPGVH